MRQIQDMNIQPIDGSTFMTILTVGFYWAATIIGNIGNVTLGFITLQGVAGVCAIAAAISTVAYNLFRFYRDYKEMQKKE